MLNLSAKKDALLGAFQLMEIPESNLKSITGGLEYWVERVFTPTGLFYVKYFEDASVELRDAIGNLRDWGETTEAGDVG